MIFQRQVLYGVVGNPIRQSLSPYLFLLWKKERNDSFTYFPFYLETEEKETFFAHLKETGIKGLNVTKPYKDLAL